MGGQAYDSEGVTSEEEGATAPEATDEAATESAE